jgi:hypothetical protein
MDVLQICEIHSILRLLDIVTWFEWNTVAPRPKDKEDAQVMCQNDEGEEEKENEQDRDYEAE